MLLLTYKDLVSPLMLEDLNNFINYGEVVGLNNEEINACYRVIEEEANKKLITP